MDKSKNMIDEIARMAYALYERRGHVPGHDFTDWIEAEKIVMKKYSKGNAGNEKPIKSTRPVRTPEKTKSRSSRTSV